MLEALAALVKGIGYAAALTAAGTILARVSWARRPAPSQPIAVRVTRWAGIALALAACAEALLFFLRLGGEADAATLDALFLSPLGAAMGLRLVGGLWAAAFARKRVALVGAVMILVAFGSVGHAATNGIVTSLTVVLHVTAAAWWLGSLLVLLGASQTRAAGFPALVERFSRQAIWVVGCLLAAALATAAPLLDFRIDLARAYPQGLLTKLALTGVLLALAGINKRILTPRLARHPGARLWLRRAILAEILLFVGVLATTAYLTTYLSPHAADDAAHARRETGAAHGPIAILDPWAPALPAGATTGVGYVTIVNNLPVADRLIGASSPWAEQVDLQATVRADGMTQMRGPGAVPIPAQARVMLRPGAQHLMFTGLYAPFVAGDTVPLTLRFARAGTITVTLTVRPVGERPADEHVH